MPSLAQDPLTFGDVTIDFTARRLTRAGREQPLEPKAFAVLALLAASPGRVFERDEILDAAWGHRHVTQGVLNRIISLIRQALGEDAQHPRVLHTVHGVGYRFEPQAVDLRTEAGPAAHVREVAVAAVAAAGGNQGTARAPRRWNAWLVASMAAAAFGLLALVILWHGRGVPTTPATTSPPSLAILPFTDLSRARDQAYLADGLADDIGSQLAQTPELRVVGRSSSFVLRGRQDDPRGIGSMLGVAYLLEGGIRRDGDRLRVTARLVQARDGTQLWSKGYDLDVHEVFEVQQEIALDVAQALRVKLDIAQFNRAQGGTTNLAAYEKFVRWRGSRMQELFDAEHDRERLQLAREMVALDAGCVLCLDALAVSLGDVARNLPSQQAARMRAEAEGARARIARDAPESWVAQRDRANALWREGKRVEAMSLSRQLAEAGPPTKERVWDYAYMLYAVGHLDDAVALVEKTRAIEPLALFLSRDLQYDYTAARRYADAEAEYQRGRQLQGSQLEPDSVAFFRQLAGKRPGGLVALRDLHGRLLRGEDFDSPFFRDLGAVLGNRSAMLGLVRKALDDPAYGGGVGRAYVWTAVADALGDADLAVAGLRVDLSAREGFEQGRMTPYSYVALWNPSYSALRAHPEFKALLVQAGVAEYWRQTGRWGDGCEPSGPNDFQCH